MDIGTWQQSRIYSIIEVGTQKSRVEMGYTRCLRLEHLKQHITVNETLSFNLLQKQDKEKK